MVIDPFAPVGNGASGKSAGKDEDIFVPAAPPRIPQYTEIWLGGLGTASAVWEYYEPSGEFSGFQCRFEIVDKDGRPSKTFRPYRFGSLNGSSPQWCWKGWKGGDRPLYGLQELQSHPEAKFILTEGEKAADAVPRLFPGYVGVSPMNGAKSPHLSDYSPLADREGAAWPDNDEPGRKFADKVAGLASKAGAASVGVVQIPSTFPEKWDLADPLPDGVTVDELARLLEEAKPWSGDEDEGTEEGGTEGKRPKQADILIKLAGEASLFHTSEFDGYADIEVNGHRETWPIRSKMFRRWLIGAYYRATRGAPNSDAMQQALGVLEAKAQFDPPGKAPLPVFVRIAKFHGKLYLDMADAKWRAIEIDTDGWRIVERSPVRFRRPKGMLPLPEPEHGGDISKLCSFVNVKHDEDLILIVHWLLCGFRDTGPYPVLVLLGEAGTAKTTLSRVLRQLIDPYKAPTRSLPRDDRDLFIAANNGWMIIIDNVSVLPDWLSDAFCRLATGGGFSTRALWTDDEEALFDAMRPIVLNGIENFAVRGDLADRALTIGLEAIADQSRKAEEAFWQDFEAARPAILGALLDAVSGGLNELPGIKLAEMPRMADFAKWGAACERGLPWKAGTFLKVYADNRAIGMASVREANPVASAVIKFVEQRGQGAGPWKGTATELLAELDADAVTSEVQRKQKWWPKAPHVLSGRLTRAAPALRQSGICVEIDHDKKSRWVSIDPSKYYSDEASPASPAPPAAPSDYSQQKQTVSPTEGGTLRKTEASPGPHEASPGDASGDAGDASKNPAHAANPLKSATQQSRCGRIYRGETRRCLLQPLSRFKN